MILGYLLQDQVICFKYSMRLVFIRNNFLYRHEYLETLCKVLSDRGARNSSPYHSNTVSEPKGKNYLLVSLLS